MPPEVVRFNDVSHAYDGHRVLSRVTFDLARGHALALVGRSGAGKSTVLKLANGLLLPDEGTVLVDGRDTRAWDGVALRRRIGYVLQHVGLFPHFTVEQNVSLVPRLERWPDDRARARAHELLDLVGLPPGEFAHRWPAELSGGQQQRVGVARALAVRPPLLLMDEPFGALDPITRVELRRAFLALQRELEQTVLLVTHDIAEAFELGTRIGILDEGTLVVCDTPSAVARSTDPRVRRLLDTTAAPLGTG